MSEGEGMADDFIGKLIDRKYRLVAELVALASPKGWYAITYNQYER